MGYRVSKYIGIIILRSLKTSSKQLWKPNLVIDSLLNYRLDGQVFIKFVGRQRLGITAQNRGIEISGKKIPIL